MTDENAQHESASTGPGPRRSLAARMAAFPFLALIVVYRGTLGQFLGGQCRFHPTCSQYALDAYREHGVIRATWLTARRLARCHPLCRGGYDPVPPPRASNPPGSGLY